MPRKKENSKKKKIIILTASLVLVVTALGTGVFLWLGAYNIFADNEADCNVLALSLNGYLDTYDWPMSEDEGLDFTSSEEILDGLLVAKDDSEVKAVLLSIDSGGGNGVAGEEVAEALKDLDKPSVAVIRSVGASAAYWAATGADKIFASRISDVGSIGVTASYLDESVKKEKEGYAYVELASAKYKDMGDLDRPMTDEEKEIMLNDLRKIHQVFVADVATNRKLEVVQVEGLANGLTYLGQEALEKGLIDEIGGLSAATKYLKNLIGEEPVICWY
ncbi:MAG TPA: S49 family peptidase [Candidatus Paceibacterota bacterium]|nr:S49 family peptidase [Candidatus Paceibacterota bacterium]